MADSMLISGLSQSLSIMPNSVSPKSLSKILAVGKCAHAQRVAV